MKPVFIVGKGTSLAGLDNHIVQFDNLDVKWCAMKKRMKSEEKILRKGHHAFDYFSFYGSLADYESNVEIIEMTKFVGDGYLGCLGFCICTLYELGYTNFCLFGCDGGVIPGVDEIYYDKNYEMGGNYQHKKGEHRKDVEMFNNIFWEKFEGFYGVNKIRVYDCSVQGNLKCFKKIEYHEIKSFYRDVRFEK